jgi:hypothetical protein
VGNIDFKVISAVENSNKFQKTRFWKEKSVKVVITRGPMAHATLSLLVTRCEASSSIRFSPAYYNFFSSGAGKLIIKFISTPIQQPKEVISIIDKIEVVTQEFMTTHHKSTTYYVGPQHLLPSPLTLKKRTFYQAV